MQKKRSFTFIELIIVMIIIGVVSAGVVVNFRNTYGSFQLHTFSREIYYLAQYLRASAVTQNKEYSLALKQLDGSLEVQALWRDDDNLLQPLTGRFSKPLKSSHGASIASIIPQEATEINFYPNGSCDEVVFVLTDTSNNQVSLRFVASTGTVIMQ